MQPQVLNPATNTMVSPRTEYTYDAFGNHVAIEDALGRVTRFGFDEHNRQSSRTLPAVSGDFPAVETTVYNDFGDVDFTVDFRGQKADYVYDYDVTGDTDLGLLRRVEYFPADSPTPTETAAFTYDAFGRRDAVTETFAGVTRLTDTDYDGEGRITRVVNADGEIHYGYDPLGRQVRMWTGSSATFAGGVTGVEYDYDPAGRLVLVREVRRANATLATPVETRSTFDYAGDLTSIATTQGAANLRHTSYTYHADRRWLMGVINEDGSDNVLSLQSTKVWDIRGRLAELRKHDAAEPGRVRARSRPAPRPCHHHTARVASGRDEHREPGEGHAECRLPRLMGGPALHCRSV